MDVTKEPSKKNGGRRPGAGRKKGSKLPATLEKEKVDAAVNQLIMEKALPIVRAMMMPALGQSFIYRIDEEITGSGPKGGEYKKRKHVLVTDPDEIALALDQIEEGGKDPDDKYYYITTQAPEYRAGAELLNRPLGKPKESLNLDVNVKFSLKGLIERRKKLEAGETEILPAKTE